MTTIPLAEARAQLSKLVDEAMRTHERVEVTKNGRRAAVILSADDYDSLIETLDILSDRDAMSEIREAEADMAAIMREYLAAEERVNQATREALERRGYDHSRFAQVKREMAEVRGFKTGEDGVEYIINQMIEFLMMSRNVEEVFSEDHTLRKTLRDVLNQHLHVDSDLDVEVRKRIKNLQEGTQSWDVEYQKVMQDLKRLKGLDA